MVNYREIMRLNSLHYSSRQIAASMHSSRNTIREVLKLAEEHFICWPLDEAVTNEVLFSTFYPERLITTNLRKEPDYSYTHKELAKSGVNLTLLWSEYCARANQEGQIPYMYTQFCEKYRHWARITKATMRIQHKPGEAMQVDWAGNPINIHDPVTGDISQAYLFVAVLPCSCHVYVEACSDMKTENWILCHVHAYGYFGGVTRLLIPDNLKAGVIKNTRYDTVLNRSYAEMAEYYGTAIVPARVKRPQDKSLAEGTVKYASTWITAALRDRKFFSLNEANRAVTEKLDELNNRAFQKREGSRLSAYLNEEKAYMQPLPISSFEPAVWSTATIQLDYLITDGKNKYSVPYDLIGETVDIRLTKSTVEAFFQGNRIASHPRREQAGRDPIVLAEHMTLEHRKYLSYNADDFRAWSLSVGEHTYAVVDAFLKQGASPEQGFKSCASLTKLADRYGYERLENACMRVLVYSCMPSIRNISTILKNGQDKVSADSYPAEKDSVTDGQYGITRGASYFSKGGTAND